MIWQRWRRRREHAHERLYWQVLFDHDGDLLVVFEDAIHKAGRTFYRWTCPP